LFESKLGNTNKKNNAGARPYDAVMLFKILILQRYYSLGDSQVEYQLLDRSSFKTFLGLATGAKVLDEDDENDSIKQAKQYGSSYQVELFSNGDSRK
jgi:hypothetical protein